MLSLPEKNYKYYSYSLVYDIHKQYKNMPKENRGKL